VLSAPALSPAQLRVARRHLGTMHPPGRGRTKTQGGANVELLWQKWQQARRECADYRRRCWIGVYPNVREMRLCHRVAYCLEATMLNLEAEMISLRTAQ